MNRPADRLYQLLPAIHRMRDAEAGEPLRALLSVINEQVNVVEDDIARPDANRPRGDGGIAAMDVRSSRARIPRGTSEGSEQARRKPTTDLGRTP